MRICLDPGHGGKSPGAINLGRPGTSVDDLPESQINLWIAEDLRTELEQRGHTVVLTREDERSGRAPSERARIANSWRADLLLSIHCNSSVNPAVRGFEVLHDDRKPSDAPVALRIATAFLEAFPHVRNRGVKTDADSPREHLPTLEKANMPAVLVEIGFLSNDSEAYWILDNLAPIARALADGVETALEGGT